MAKIMACRLFLSLLALLVSQTETSPIKVDTKMRQFVDDLGKKSGYRTTLIGPILMVSLIFQVMLISFMESMW